MKHPVASCVMTYIVASSGGILANLMTGAPPLECVANGWSVAVAVISWYIMHNIQQKSPFVELFAYSNTGI